MIGVWHNENLSQYTNTIGIRTSLYECQFVNKKCKKDDMKLIIFDKSI